MGDITIQAVPPQPVFINPNPTPVSQMGNPLITGINNITGGAWETNGPHGEALAPNQQAAVTREYPGNYVNQSDIVGSWAQNELKKRSILLVKHEYFGSFNPNTTDNQTPLFNQLGGSYPLASTGQRLAMNVQTNNPNLVPPNNVAKQFYGAMPTYKVAMDQPLPRKVAKFQQPTDGAAAQSHDFANNPVYNNGTQNIASVTGYMLYGSQFTGAVGATQLIAGGLNNVISMAFNRIVQNGIANNTQPLIPGVDSFISILSNIIGIDFSAIINAISAVVATGADIVKNTNAQLVQQQLNAGLTASIGNQPLAQIAPIANQLAGSNQIPVGTLQKIAAIGNVLGSQQPNPDPTSVQNTPVIQNTLSKALSNLSFTQFLENNVRQAILDLVPGASQIIFHTLNTSTIIAQQTGGNITQSLTPTQPSSS